MTDVPDFIAINKEKLMNVWACLVMDSHEEAYHQLYTAWSEDPHADPYHAFDMWWTDKEGMDALERMRGVIGEPEEEPAVLDEEETELICKAILFYGQHIAMGQSGGDEILPQLDVILEKLGHNG